MALIPSEPKKQVAFLAGFLALAGLYAFYDYWYVPRQLEFEQLQVRFEALDSANRRARALATRGMDETQERVAVMNRHLRQLELLIPSPDDVPRLLENLATEARRSGLGDLASITPAPVVPVEHYFRASYELSVSGGYHEVGRFLTAIASLPRIIAPIDLNITARPGTRGRAGTPEVEPGQVSARFRVHTYVLPGSDEEIPFSVVPTGSPAADGPGPEVMGPMGVDPLPSASGVTPEPVDTPAPAPPAEPTPAQADTVGGER